MMQPDEPPRRAACVRSGLQTGILIIVPIGAVALLSQDPRWPSNGWSVASAALVVLFFVLYRIGYRRGQWEHVEMPQSASETPLPIEEPAPEQPRSGPLPLPPRFFLMVEEEDANQVAAEPTTPAPESPEARRELALDLIEYCTAGEDRGG